MTETDKEDPLTTVVKRIRELLIDVAQGKRPGKENGLEALGLFNWLFGFPPYDEDEDGGRLLKAQRRRIAEEREACAKIAESFFLEEPGEMSIEYRIAEAIRARSNS